MNRLIWASYIVPSLVGALLVGVAIAMRPFGFSALLSAGVAVALVVLSALLATPLRRTSLTRLLAGFLGLVAGALLGFALILLSHIPALAPSSSLTFFRLALPVLFAYVGLTTGLSKASELPGPSAAATVESSPVGKVLDTSVLIDGRISDIVESGFLEGPLIVPRFVLHELQVVADSADSTRRARGRRGLDVVQHLQSLPNSSLEVSSQDFASTREVDLKLIEFAKLRSAKIVTNDFNLNKLAQVQGISVLNINELANSLKPVVLPGEIMRVFVLKEGKEHGQGIAYLDDGTMVVVDNARRMMSKNIDIVVTSVLQTTAGKMIFGRYDAHAEARPISASASS